MAAAEAAACLSPLELDAFVVACCATLKLAAFAYFGNRWRRLSPISLEQTAIKVLNTSFARPSPPGLEICFSNASTKDSTCWSIASWPNMLSMRRIESKDAWKTARFEESIAFLTMGIMAFATISACWLPFAPSVDSVDSSSPAAPIVFWSRGPLQLDVAEVLREDQGSPCMSTGAKEELFDDGREENADGDLSK